MSTTPPSKITESRDMADINSDIIEILANVEVVPDTSTSIEDISTSFDSSEYQIETKSGGKTAHSISGPDYDQPTVRLAKTKYEPMLLKVYWEAENTTCYQVKYSGVIISRREDTDYINCTKLLNAVGFSRGKRDGRLKLEKDRKICKVGSNGMKGIWLPFDRALEMARNEGIDKALYPLFEDDLRFVYDLLHMGQP